MGNVAIASDWTIAIVKLAINGKCIASVWLDNCLVGQWPSWPINEHAILSMSSRMVPDHASVIEVVQKSTGNLNPDRLQSTEHIISP